MKKTVLTKSSINRALSMLRRLKKKDFGQQIRYLTAHRIARQRDKSELIILLDIQRNRQPEEKLFETIAYKNVQWFWSDLKFQTFVSYKQKLEAYRKMVCSQDDRSDDDPEVVVEIPEELAIILQWLQLVNLS